MKKILILVALLISGCISLTGESKQKIKVESEIIPSKISLEEQPPLSLEVRITNIGKSAETITADAASTEGLSVSKPNKTTLTLKPGESRIIVFNATLTRDAVPGDYIVDVQIKTESGEVASSAARLRVVAKKGLI
jgi:uncharacterized membrane protein